MMRQDMGFTLIELLVVVMIIGVLAAIALPQYFKVLEKGKVDEAVSALEAARGAQERFKAKYGAYCTGAIAACGGFDLLLPSFKYFNPLTSFAAGAGSPSWKASLQRTSPGSSFYGAYTITYTVEPVGAPIVACTGGSSPAACTADLLTQIH